jgi:hypothetical protein
MTPDPSDLSERIVEWSQLQIDAGSVIVGGVRVYDDGTVVNHADLDRPTESA